MTHAEHLADMITTAQRIAIFTGAGISTESGIPDFRSPGGVWSKMAPIYFQDFVASAVTRREAWERVFNRTAGWTGASPNAGHFAIASLIASGKACIVVTQNVDNLHQDSGVPDDKVIEIHGNATHAKCLECAQRYEFETLQPRWESGADLRCDKCDGLIKTATISFGQAMPEDKMEHAATEMAQCDLCIVLGSSLVVYPAANLPLIAIDAGARLAIINREPTDHDQHADAVIHEDIGALMTETMKIVDA